MNKLLLVAALAVGAAGCLDGVSGTGGGGPTDDETPRELFDRTVTPLLQGKCALCHVGAVDGTPKMFLGTQQSGASYYQSLTNDAELNGNWQLASAGVLMEPEHEGPQSVWSTAEQPVITAWIVAEAHARGIDPGDPGTPGDPTASARGTAQQWAACMSVSVSDYMDTTAYSVVDIVTDHGTCDACHEPAGAGGAWWGRGDNYMTMLHKWREEKFMSAAFVPALASQNPIRYRMQVNDQKICDKGHELENNLGTHPAFDCNANGEMDNMKAFAVQVQIHQDQHLCPTPIAYAPND
jgi:hypothetical protein